MRVVERVAWEGKRAAQLAHLQVPSDPAALRAPSPATLRNLLLDDHAEHGLDPSIPSSAWQHGRMGREHRYQATITWTGNLGEGTAGYRSYSRDHEVSGIGKPVLPGSSDPASRGDPKRWNPEELLVAALSQCHMLWFLNLCAVNGIVVISYADDAQGSMVEGGDGGGEFTAVTLRPRAAIADSGQANRALELHEEAHRLCFIARSVNFPVSCEPVIT